MRRTLLALLALPALSALFAACGPSDPEVDRQFQAIVHERASREFPCAWQHVAVSPLTGWAYIAEGCGLEQVYECGFETGHFDDADKTLYVCHASASDPTAPGKPDGG